MYGSTETTNRRATTKTMSRSLRSKLINNKPMIRLKRSQKIRCRVDKKRCRRAKNRCGKESPTKQEETRESTSRTTEMEHLNRTIVRINCSIQQQTDDSAVIRVDTKEESEGETKRKAVGQSLIR